MWQGDNGRRKIPAGEEGDGMSIRSRLAGNMVGGLLLFGAIVLLFKNVYMLTVPFQWYTICGINPAQSILLMLFFELLGMIIFKRNRYMVIPIEVAFVVTLIMMLIDLLLSMGIRLQHLDTSEASILFGLSVVGISILIKANIVGVTDEDRYHHIEQ